MGSIGISTTGIFSTTVKHLSGKAQTGTPPPTSWLLERHIRAGELAILKQKCQGYFKLIRRNLKKMGIFSWKTRVCVRIFWLRLHSLSLWWMLGYSRKNSNRAGGRLRKRNFQGYLRNSMSNFHGLNKNKVEFPKAAKKK